MLLLAMTLAGSLCFDREPLKIRLLRISANYEVSVVLNPSLDGKEAPPICASTANEALQRSLMCSGIRYEIRNNIIRIGETTPCLWYNIPPLRLWEAIVEVASVNNRTVIGNCCDPSSERVPPLVGIGDMEHALRELTKSRCYWVNMSSVQEGRTVFGVNPYDGPCGLIPQPDGSELCVPVLGPTQLKSCD